jgi:hypothetical protein
LRESAIALDEDAMWQVLHEGALLPKGMPRFPNFTREQVHQLYSYIRAGARAASAGGDKGQEPGDVVGMGEAGPGI